MASRLSRTFCLVHLLLLLGLSAWWAPARAEPVLVAYGGSGNAVLFDASTGSGGWVGAIDEVPDPAIASPLSLVSVVLFSYDAASGLLSGSFEFTDSLDLDSALFGRLSGRSADADPFGLGGQFEIDYLIDGGSGRFAGFSGFGLAFLSLDPAAAGDNYRESGLLVLAVPVPGTLLLVALALALVALKQSRARRESPALPLRLACARPSPLSCATPTNGPRASTSSAAAAGSARATGNSWGSAPA
jgi:hypothetical protein